MKNLTDKVALVTGGSRGIGAGIVRVLAAAGARVAFTYVRAAEQARALVAEIEQHGGVVLALQADTAVRADVRQALDEVVRQFGPLDILVNNAGVFVASPVDETAPDEAALRHLWEVNTLGTAQTVRDAAPHLAAGGRIINIGSGSAIRIPYVGTSDYAATKAALATYTRGWARDLAPRRITVNIIQPGLIDTDFLPTDPAVRAELAPANRAGPPRHGAGNWPGGGLPGQRRGRLHYGRYPERGRRLVHLSRRRGVAKQIG